MGRIAETLNNGSGWKVGLTIALGFATIMLTLMLAFRSESQAADYELRQAQDDLRKAVAERLDAIQQSTTRTETIIQEAQRNGRL